MKLNRLMPRVRDVGPRLCGESPVATIYRHIGRSGSGELRLRGRALQERNDRIRLRDGYTCKGCGCVADRHEGQVDHIIPLHLGGSDDDINLQWLCHECHVRKTEQEQRA